ncbi:MAG: hypothetical protein ACSHYB_09235 [Roseibacillus sp.]
MHSTPLNLFSIRTLLLVVISVCAARSNAATIDSLGGLPNAAPPSLQSTALERNTFTVLDNFLPSSTFDTNLDAILVLSERTFVEEVLDDNDLFILTSGPEVNARKWLAYLAPESLSLDLALQNSTILLQSLSGQPSLDSPLGVTATLPPNILPNESFPAQIFLGIDLDKVNSPSLEPSFGSANEFQQFTLSEFVSGSSGSIPEPTSAALLLLSAISSLCHRRRSR